jgi:hypothetical protein
MVAAAGIMPLQQWLDLQPDNFLTRMLCGLRCLRRPKFQLTHEDHLYTLNRLENFDNIILLEHFDDTFGKFASEVGWRNNAGKVITPWTTKRHKMLQHSKHQIADDNSISERYTILDDALYEFAMARVVPVDNQSIFHKFGNFSFSENVTQSLNKYFQMPTNNCSTPCCEKCRFQFKWGKHLNHLFVNSAK